MFKLFSRLSSKARPSSQDATPSATIDTSLDVFVSYKSEEKGLAGLLVAQLEILGFSVWWDGKLAPGDAYQRTINENLARAKSVIVIWSSASIESDWVRSEAEHARERNVIVPIRTDEANIWPPFNTLHTLDFCKWNGDYGHAGFQDLVAHIRKNAGLPPLTKLAKPAPTPGDIIISRSAHLVHKIKAKDSTGEWAYYFVHVLPHNEDAFLEQLDQKDGIIDLEDYGVVIASNYGETPSPEVKAFLKTRYDFSI